MKTGQKEAYYANRLKKQKQKMFGLGFLGISMRAHIQGLCTHTSSMCMHTCPKPKPRKQEHNNIETKTSNLACLKQRNEENLN